MRIIKRGTKNSMEEMAPTDSKIEFEDLKNKLISLLDNNYLFSEYTINFIKDETHSNLPLRYFTYVSLYYFLNNPDENISKKFSTVQNLPFRDLNGKQLNKALLLIINNFNYLSINNIKNSFAFLKQHANESDKYFTYFENILFISSDTEPLKRLNEDEISGKLLHYLDFFSSIWSTIMQYSNVRNTTEVWDYFDNYFSNLHSDAIFRIVFCNIHGIIKILDHCFLNTIVLNYIQELYDEYDNNFDDFIEKLPEYNRKFEAILNVKELSFSNDKIDFILNDFVLYFLLDSFSAREIIQIYLTGDDELIKTINNLSFSEVKSIIVNSGGGIPLSWAMSLYHDSQ